MSKNKPTLAEDPNTLHPPHTDNAHNMRPWAGKEPEEIRSWAHEHLHHKLTAQTVYAEGEHPEWAWFRKSGFGLFLHWGPASLPPADGDAWKMVWCKEREEHDMLALPEDMFSAAESWDPEAYDPDTWLKAAAEAGFGYAVLSTRHHDGYCLWPSAHGDWHTGTYMQGRDLVNEYIHACRTHGLRVGLYYSGPNWHYAYQQKDFSWPPKGYNHRHEKVEGVDPPLAGLMGGQPLPPELEQSEQAESAAQVTELMTQYGPIDMMWWDGHSIMTEQELAALQPDIFVARGNIATPEGRHMGASENVKVTNEAGWWWEICLKSEKKDSPYWHYNPSLETNHWDANTFLRELIRCRSLGGNLLVNITPRPNGEMMDWYYEVCRELADWMAHSQEAVYDVDLNAPLPTLDITANCVTVRGNTWYAMPDENNEICIENLQAPNSVQLLRSGEPLPYDYHQGVLSLSIPETLQTPLPDMVRITLSEA